MTAARYEFLGADVEIQQFGGITILTDLLPGGTKERALRIVVARDREPAILVYASPRQGLAQVAIARVARLFSKRAVIFCAASKRWTPETKRAAGEGAEIHEVPVGYFSVVQARARVWAAEARARLLPFGLDFPEMVSGIATAVRELLPDYAGRVWCAAGSGTLSRGLARAWPSASIVAVSVGREAVVGDAELIRAPEPFERRALDPPPVSSPPTYDAKVWQFCKDQRGLFWNVARATLP